MLSAYPAHHRDLFSLANIHVCAFLTHLFEVFFLSNYICTLLVITMAHNFFHACLTLVKRCWNQRVPSGLSHFPWPVSSYHDFTGQKSTSIYSEGPKLSASILRHIKKGNILLWLRQLYGYGALEWSVCVWSSTRDVMQHVWSNEWSRVKK